MIIFEIIGVFIIGREIGDLIGTILCNWHDNAEAARKKQENNNR